MFEVITPGGESSPRHYLVYEADPQRAMKMVPSTEGEKVELKAELTENALVAEGMKSGEVKQQA